jgi:hypothetical protein
MESSVVVVALDVGEKTGGGGVPALESDVED